MIPEEREIFKRIADGLEKIEKNPPLFFGLTPRDLFTMAGILLTLGAFYIRTNDAIIRLVKSSEYFTAFAQNSDSYNSAATGTLFFQGRPLNPGFDTTIYKPKIYGTQEVKTQGAQ